MNMKTSVLKRLATTLFLLTACLVMSAQSTSLKIDEASFREVQQDALTGVSIDPIMKDRSNRACARIKLHLNRMTPAEIAQVTIKPIGGNIIIMKKTTASDGNGIIFELTARQGVRFYIVHPTIGESNAVTVNLEGNKEYYMEGWSEQKYSVTIECNRVGAEVSLDGQYQGVIPSSERLTLTSVSVGSHIVRITDGADVTEQKIDVSMSRIYFPISLESHQQYVVFSLTPANATVELDGMVLDVADGAAFANKHFGTYEYIVRAPRHHPVSGTVIVNDPVNKHIVNVVLSPAFGWLSITSDHETNGADVYLDEEYIGKLPFSSKEIPSGEHSLRITKPKYKPFQTIINVKDNETSNITPKLQAHFANVTLKVDGDAEIWVNGERKGQGIWSGQLTLGPNKIETRKAGHRSQVSSYDINALMEGQTMTLKAPEAIYGTLVIESTPPFSDVYIDGKLFGQTPVRTNMNIGSHHIRIVKNGYQDYETTATIAEGDVTTVSRKLAAGSGSSSKTVASVPKKEEKKEAEREVDGKDVVYRKIFVEVRGSLNQFDMKDSFLGGTFGSWSAGVLARYSFHWFSIQSGLMYGSAKVSTRQADPDASYYTDIKLNSLKLPLQLVRGIGFNKVAIVLEAGAYFKYMLDGEISFVQFDESGRFDQLSQAVMPLFQGSSEDPIGRTEFGLSAGAKLRFGGFGLGVSYDYGIGNLGKYITAMPTSLNFFVSYSF